MRTRRGQLVALGVGGVLVTALAWAASDGSQPTLHEDLPGPKHPASLDDVGAQPMVGDAQAGQNPTAFADKGKYLPEPNLDLDRGQKEPTFAPDRNTTDPNQASREDETKPDRHTEADGTLHYTEVFNPAVVPFKRMNAFDAARADYTLYSAGKNSRDELPVGGGSQKGRDKFWGSILVELSTGTDVPIPSVAPDMRILSYETEPAGVRLTFSKDAADNYYLRTDEAGVDRKEHRVVFLVDADQRYFGTSVPAGYRVRDLVNQPGAPDMLPLPSQVQRMGLRGAAELGVSADMELEPALDRLVRYFRDFKAGDPPAGNDIYWDLFINQVGVCRHRSFVFMITANAVGIPTRYLTNEAHAWVEVWLPTPGWIRVDLGGAALELEVSNAKDKTMYRPPKKDTFGDVRPPNYENSYTELKGDIQGLSQAQIDEAQTPVDPTQKDDAAGDGDGDGDGDQDDVRLGPDQDLPTPPPDAFANKEEVDILIDGADAAVYRGEPLRVRGRFQTKAGVPLGGQRLDLWLVSPLADDKGVLLGETITLPDGTWHAEVEVPTGVRVRRYEIRLYYNGDKKYAPAQSY